MLTNQITDFTAIAQQVLLKESKALTSVAERLDANFNRAIALMMHQKRKIIVCAVGKSGHIGRKIVATLNSTGSKAVFLHAAEAIHGDLGIYEAGDTTILISKSGTSQEITKLIPIFKNFLSPIIAITGNLNSPLAKKADVVLDATVQEEADLLGIVPTCSSTVALALGDALAVALMHANQFTEEDFARFHPGGQLGKNLILCVKDIMHPFEAVACVYIHTSLKEIVLKMTSQNLGAACVIDTHQELVGLITDGDLRRALVDVEDINQLHAQDFMTKNPICIYADVKIQDALKIMEERTSQLSVLPVVDHAQKLIGLIRIHDIYQVSLV